jgi:ribonuclease HII
MADMSACSLGRLSEATNEAITPYFDENNTRKRPLMGVDEAGRGALAGPIVACCVQFKPTFSLHSELNDSKQLSAAQRHTIFNAMKDDIYLGVGMASHRLIDKINVFQATMIAMTKAINKIANSNHHVIIDGNRVPKIEGPTCEAIVKADTKVAEVKAASICAKVLRDRLMEKYDRFLPEYGFKKHKGYGTKLHYTALFDYGKSVIHRESFNLSKQLTLWN